MNKQELENKIADLSLEESDVFMNYGLIHEILMEREINKVGAVNIKSGKLEFCNKLGIPMEISNKSMNENIAQISKMSDPGRIGETVLYFGNLGCPIEVGLLICTLVVDSYELYTKLKSEERAEGTMIYSNNGTMH